MKRPISCLVALLGLFIASTGSAQVNGNSSQVSLLNGLNNFAGSSSKDSVYFLKSGINLGVQGNYFWKSIGVAGRLGYFTNNPSEDKISDFGLSRKATADRAMIASKPYKGYYWLAGPAFQTTFTRWQVESNVLGGMFHYAESGILIGDRFSPDIVYYRNKMEAGSSFAWNVGFGLNYSISSLVRLGISADYLSTQSDVVNTDINRGGGQELQSISSQANFLSTALKVSYSLHNNRSENRNNWRKSSVNNSQKYPGKTLVKKKGRPASAQNKSSDCDCENKTMDIAYLEPLTIDITFNTLEEAQQFLKTGNNPLYGDKGKGENPLYSKREAGSGMATGKRQHKPVTANFDDATNSFELNGKYYVVTTREAGSGMATGRRQYQPIKMADAGNNDDTPGISIREKGDSKSDIAIDEPGVHRGAVIRTNSGEQVFAVFPTIINLAQLSILEGGAISVHVKNKNQSSTGNSNPQLKAQNNNTVRSNRTGNALFNNNDSTGGNSTKVADHNSSRSNKSSNITDNGNGDTDSQHTKRDVASGLPTSKRQHKPMNVEWDETGDVIKSGDEFYVNISSREKGSGLATGKRQHKPVMANFEEATNTFELNGQYYTKITAPRDVATGLSTGKRQHKPMNVEWHETDDILKAGNDYYVNVTAREKGSGLATGKRQHKPVMANFDDVTNTYELNGQYYARVVSPRDAASGLPTGKRQHKPMKVEFDETGNMIKSGNDYYVNVTPRDAASGLPTGKRQHKPVTANFDEATNTFELNGQYYTKAVSPRDAASGLPTGKRQHKPVSVGFDETGDMIKTGDEYYINISTRERGSGLATGKRQHKPVTANFDETTNTFELDGQYYTKTIAPRDAASGLPTGKRQHKPVRIEFDETGDVIKSGNDYYVNVTTRETGSGLATGKRQHQPVTAMYDDATNTFELNGQYYAGTTAPRDAASGLPTGKRQHKPMTVMFDEENDEIDIYGTVYSEVKTARERGSGLATGRRQYQAFTDDSNSAGSTDKNTKEHVHGDPHVDQKDGTRIGQGAFGVVYKISNTRPVRCEDGSCQVECTIEINGKKYEAVMSVVVKARHEAAMNAIRNMK